MRVLMLQAAAAVGSFCIAFSVVPAEEFVLTQVWPQFRGLNSAGTVQDESSEIVEFGPGKRMLWKLALPGGHSSPCIWNEHVFLTTFDPLHRKLELLKISRGSGTVDWRVTIPASEIEKAHPDFNPASSTPTTDGQRVVAYFGSYGIICFDYDGKQQWLIPMPLATSYSGSGASPVIVDNKVIFYRATYKDHYVLAVSLSTGEEIWKYKFFWPFRSNHSCAATPLIYKDQVILHYVNGVSTHSLADGKPVWWVNASTTATSTHVMGKDELFVATWNQTGEPDLIPEYPDFETALEEHDKNADKMLSRGELPTLAYFHRPEGQEAAQSYAGARFQSVDRNRSGQIDSSYHTTVGPKKIELVWAEGFPGGGQVVDSLQSEPECLRAGLCRWSDYIAPQRSNHADHLIQGWRIRRRILLTNSHVNGFPFTGFENDFAIEVGALTAKVA